MKRSTGGTPISLFKLATFPIDKQLTLQVQLRQHEVLDQLCDARPPLLHLFFDDDNENSIWSPIMTRSSQGSNGSGSPASPGPQPWYFWDLSRWLFGSRPPRVVRVSPGGPVPLEELESGTRMTSSLQRTKNKQIWNLRVIRFLLFLKGTFMENLHDFLWFFRFRRPETPNFSSQVQLQRIVAARAARVHGCYRAARWGPDRYTELQGLGESRDQRPGGEFCC